MKIMSENNVKNGKSTLTVRGSAKMNRETGDFAFKAYETGEPDHKNVRKHGCCTVYETEGRKESSIVAHLRVKRETVDPFGEMYGDFAVAMKPYMKKEPSVANKGKMLCDTPDAKVWHNKTKGVVNVLITIATDVPDMTNELLSATQTVNKCLASNKTSLSPRR